MQAVKIADLKNNLSRHLARVKRGGELTVMDRNTPIARIVPFTPAARPGERAKGKTDATERIEALTRQGILSPGHPQAVAEWAAQHQPITRPKGAPSAVDLLLEMRRESRR
jgi:prevent-host-death family protein